jgi:hypothetical protein
MTAPSQANSTVTRIPDALLAAADIVRQRTGCRSRTEAFERIAREIVRREAALAKRKAPPAAPEPPKRPTTAKRRKTAATGR